MRRKGRHDREDKDVGGIALRFDQSSIKEREGRAALIPAARLLGLNSNNDGYLYLR